MKRSRKSRIAGVVIAAFAALLAASGAPALQPATQTAVEIVFLDVGQGDAALITAPDGSRVLVDAGPRGSGVASYLRRRGIDTLELVVASHNHADHIGGMREVFQGLAVKNYVENGLPSASATYQNLVPVIARTGARVLEAAPRSLNVGELRIRVLPTPAGETTQNNRSVGLVLELGRFAALFTGDAEEAALAHWLREAQLQQMDVVKVAHHGARNGTTAELVRATRPAVAIVSVGARNQYGHPSPRALRMWTAVARHVLRTDQHGAVTVLGASDGSMRVSTARGAPPLRNVVITRRHATGAAR